MSAILKWIVTPRAGAESLTQADSSLRGAVETPTDRILSGDAPSNVVTNTESPASDHEITDPASTQADSSAKQEGPSAALRVDDNKGEGSPKGDLQTPVMENAIENIVEGVDDEVHDLRVPTVRRI